MDAVFPPRATLKSQCHKVERDPIGRDGWEVGADGLPEIYKRADRSKKKELSRHEKATRSNREIIHCLDLSSRFIQKERSDRKETRNLFLMNQIDRGVREMSFVNCCLAAIKVSCQPKRSIKATAHRWIWSLLLHLLVSSSSVTLPLDVIPSVLNTSVPSPTTTLNTLAGKLSSANDVVYSPFAPRIEES